jgi:membrane associated rhomboid family serine protease
MFSVRCECGNSVDVEEAKVNSPFACPKCRREIVCACADDVAGLVGAGDFDAMLLVKAGPTGRGRLMPLGGCVPIELGAGEGNHIALPGELVSRSHCQLVRLDFGPSRWSLEDKASANGVFVNGQRITSHALQHGDVIDIGEYELHYKIPPAIEEPAEVEVAIAEAPLVATTRRAAAKPASLAPTGPRPICPSCDLQLTPGAKICVDCGIHLPSGRPLLTSEGLDENTVYGNAETALRVVSWIVWVTPLPIPLASAAYGKHKPYAIWTIAAITVLVSLIVFFACWNGDPPWAQNLMLWPRNADVSALTDQMVRKMEQAPEDRVSRHAPGDSREEPLSKEELRAQVEDVVERNTGQFHWWQLLTHALLHDTGSILGFVLHLAGNMLFLIVFGSRVNAILGNLLTALLYPVLAVAAAAVYLWSLSAGHLAPMLGASGAINGLAGMYLVLFPAHRVYCAMWIRLTLIGFTVGFRTWIGMKIFAMRGFWLLLIYFAFDTIMVMLGNNGTTAHWAHIGGFLTGVALGVAILVSRTVNCRNGDLLSIALGKHAWPLIGKPSRWTTRPIAGLPVAS